MSEAGTSTREGPPSDFGRWLSIILVSLAVVLSIVAVGLTIFHSQSGLFVVVANHQSSVAKDVVVFVVGETIKLGDISPSKQRRVKIHPISGQQIEIEFTDGSGKRDRHSFEHEFQPNFHGELEFRLLDGAVGCANLTEPP